MFSVSAVIHNIVAINDEIRGCQQVPTPKYKYEYKYRKLVLE